MWRDVNGWSKTKKFEKYLKSIKADPDASVNREIIRYAKERHVRTLSCRAFY